MTIASSQPYYAWQLGGWSLLLLLLCGWMPHAAKISATLCMSGLVASHGLRMAIVRYRWWRLSAAPLIGRIMVAMAAISMATVLVRWGLSRLFTGEWLPVEYILGSTVVLFLTLFAWTAGYCCLHLLREDSRRQARIRQLKERVERLF